MPIEESEGAEASAGTTGHDPITLDTLVLITQGPQAGRTGMLTDFTRRAARGIVIIEDQEYLVPVDWLTPAA